MLEFLKAALPWIIIGAAIAVFAANHVNTKKKQAERGGDGDGERRDDRISEGMCMGMCAGVVLSTTGVCDLGTGISLGLLLGEVVGMCIKK